MSHIDFCFLYVCNHREVQETSDIKMYSFGLVHSNFNSANWSQK